MKPKALIVEDDARIIESIEDALFSIGHDHDWATNQHDAQQLLQKNDYNYVLLDLQIPAKANRGGADKEFGCNLLFDIQRIKCPQGIPVIVMTANLSDCLDLTTKLQRNGASEFIAKPFSNKGRTLASVIRGVLEKWQPRPKKLADVVKEAPITPETFSGGELVFHSDRVSLCDVTILVNSRAKQMRKILDALRPRNRAGSFVAKSGPELADEIGIRAGQNGVAGAIRDFRKNVSIVLLEQLSLDCKSQDVIRSGGPGYRFNEWISVRDAEAVSVEPPCKETDEEQTRSSQILSALKNGRKLRTPALATELGCSIVTAKRELDNLRANGTVEFVGPAKTGAYQLKQ